VRYRPEGYIGLNHETIGSDILSILNAVHFPEAVLGEEVTARLRALDPQGWYPIDEMLNLMEVLDERLGVGGLLKMGKQLFKLSHEAHFVTVVKSARDAVYGLDGMYHFANRGQGIGGWCVLHFEDGLALMQKNTPHHCVMEEGILSAAFSALGIPASIKQTCCLRRGDKLCEFKIESAVKGPRWMGEAA
jgi:hypothetical protein